MRIGRHDGTGRIGTAMGRERLVGGRDGCLKRVDRQNLSDHTRRGNQDLLGLAANNLRGDVARLARAQARPVSPVAAFALPELIETPAMMP